MGSSSERGSVPGLQRRAVGDEAEDHGLGGYDERGREQAGLVLVDERFAALTARVERAPGKVAKQAGRKDVTLVSPLRTEGVGAAMSVEGTPTQTPSRPAQNAFRLRHRTPSPK